MGCWTVWQAAACFWSTSMSGRSPTGERLSEAHLAPNRLNLSLWKAFLSDYHTAGSLTCMLLGPLACLLPCLIFAPLKPHSLPGRSHISVLRLPCVPLAQRAQS